MQTEKKNKKRWSSERKILRRASPNAIASFQEVGSSLPIGQQPDPHPHVIQVLSQTNLSISSIIHPLTDGPALPLLKRDPGLLTCQQVWTFLVSWAEFTRSELRRLSPALVTPPCLSALCRYCEAQRSVTTEARNMHRQFRRDQLWARRASLEGRVFTSGRKKGPGVSWLF